MTEPLPLTPELQAKADMVAEHIRKALANTGLADKRLVDTGSARAAVVATVMKQLENAMVEESPEEHLNVTCIQDPEDLRMLVIRITPLTAYGRAWLAAAKLQAMDG